MSPCEQWMDFLSNKLRGQAMTREAWNKEWSMWLTEFDYIHRNDKLRH